MKGRQKLHHFCSTCYHKIFMSKELLLKNIEKIGRFFKLDFRALPRFGAFWPRDLCFTIYKLQSFVNHPWKFEEDIFSRFGGDSARDQISWCSWKVYQPIHRTCTEEMEVIKLFCTRTHTQVEYKSDISRQSSKLFLCKILIPTKSTGRLWFHISVSIKSKGYKPKTVHSVRERTARGP